MPNRAAPEARLLSPSWAVRPRRARVGVIGGRRDPVGDDAVDERSGDRYLSGNGRRGQGGGEIARASRHKSAGAPARKLLAGPARSSGAARNEASAAAAGILSSSGPSRKPSTDVLVTWAVRHIIRSLVQLAAPIGAVLIFVPGPLGIRLLTVVAAGAPAVLIMVMMISADVGEPADEGGLPRQHRRQDPPAAQYQRSANGQRRTARTQGCSTCSAWRPALGHALAHTVARAEPVPPLLGGATVAATNLPPPPPPARLPPSRPAMS